jgi:hypothetical protein
VLGLVEKSDLPLHQRRRDVADYAHGGRSERAGVIVGREVPIGNGDDRYARRGGPSDQDVGAAHRPLGRSGRDVQ